MGMPEQIRKQTEDVQKLYAEMNAEQGGEEADSAPTETQEPEAQDVQDDVQANSVVDEAPSDAASEHGSKEGSDGFEHKYKTLQGMYNADVARLQASTKQYESRVSQLEQLIATMSSAPAQQSAPANVEATPLVTDADRDEYGESIDVMRKVSKEELYPLMSKMSALENTLNQLTASLNTNLVPQVQRVAQQQAQSSEDRFWTSLTQAVPDWQQINNDQDFQTWLLEVDPLTGNSRQRFLEQAQQALDVNRVVAFFNTFKTLTGKTPNTNAQSNRSASELEKQVAPGRSRGSSAPTSQTAKTYTPGDIKKFFSDVQKGKYKGRESERDRLERDIFAAQREGRIAMNA